MKRLLSILMVALAFGLSACAQTQTRITATITVTNAPTTNGMTLVVNGATRTWTNVVVNAASEVLTNATIGGSATNMWNQIAANSFSGPISPYFTSTNVINLSGALNQAMVLSQSGDWCAITYSTQTVSTLQTVRVPMSSEQNSVRTNIATLLVTNISDYAQMGFGSSINLLTNYVNVPNTQTISGAKSITNQANLYSGEISNAFSGDLRLYYFSSNAPTKTKGIYFRNVAGQYVANISPDGTGRPSLYDVSYSASTPVYPVNAMSFSPFAENILNMLSASNMFAGLLWANSFTGTNTFARITNSAIVNSSALYLTSLSGTMVALTNGFLVSGGMTNYAVTNSTFYQTNYFTGIRGDTKSDVSSLANGNNSGLDFGTKVFIKLTAGPSAAFAICGISGGGDGRRLTIYNSIAQNMTIANDSGVDAVATNRIYTLTGGDIATTGIGIVNLIYDITAQRWLVESIRD